MILQGKTILLGVCGGIAAYKAAALCSKLAQAGADVRVVMTASAGKFVGPLTFQTLSRHDVAIDTFDEKDPAVVSHIDLADRADLVIIAPATANMIAKLALGLADDMLSTTLLATTAPILIAPAMNVHMYAHPAVQANMETLRARGVRFIEPGEGQLACGYVGKGRLAEPDDIYAAIVNQLKPPIRPLQGKHLLVTAGGTVERMDPVRYLTNDSSGKMGIAIAEVARDLGAEVTLIHGKMTIPPPSGMKETIAIESAAEMLDAIMERFSDMDIVVKAAAVADYRPMEQATQKLKKKDEEFTLHLVKNPDIVQTLGSIKTKQFIVAFAAETSDLDAHALDKVKRKNSDLLVANNVTLPGAGFGSDTNIVSFFDRNGLVEQLPLMDKKLVAQRLMHVIVDRLGLEGRE